jgi:hypothetical protein
MLCRASSLRPTAHTYLRYAYCTCSTTHTKTNTHTRQHTYLYTYISISTYVRTAPAQPNTHTHTRQHTYLYTYISICTYVRTAPAQPHTPRQTHTHTRQHTYLYTYISICTYVRTAPAQPHRHRQHTHINICLRAQSSALCLFPFFVCRTSVYSPLLYVCLDSLCAYICIQWFVPIRCDRYLEPNGGEWVWGSAGPSPVVGTALRRRTLPTRRQQEAVQDMNRHRDNRRKISHDTRILGIIMDTWIDDRTQSELTCTIQSDRTV